jgi:hypothetical protein
MRHHSAPTPQPQHVAEEKSGFSWFIVIVGIGSLLIVLQALGIFKTIDSEKSVSVMDVRSGEYENRRIPQRRLEKQASLPEVDKVMAELKDEFESPVFTDIQTANEHKDWGLSADEAKFYDDMRQRYAATQNNWLGVVRHASGIYKTIQDVFGTDNPTNVLQDARTAATVFSRLQSLFGISTSESLNFAQSGRGTQLSDWANFVVSRMKKRG